MFVEPVFFAVLDVLHNDYKPPYTLTPEPSSRTGMVRNTPFTGKAQRYVALPAACLEAGEGRLALSCRCTGRRLLHRVRPA